MKKPALHLSFLAALICSGFLGAAVAEEQPKSINVPAGDLITALKSFTKQTGVEVVYLSERLAGLKTHGVTGTLPPRQALTKMLEGTALEVKRDSSGAVLITSGSPSSTSASGAGSREIQLSRAQAQDASTENTANTEDPPAGDAPQAGDPRGDSSGNAGELTVTGTRIRGAQRGAAPITVIDRETIERRGFSSVEDIIRSLPQNLATMSSARSVTQPVGSDGVPVGPAAQGEVTANLRGLGQSSTLVLVNGRRTAGSAAFSGSAVNLASIPTASIERVEVLSDSAAAVYGSDAIAGVINIVLRENFRGATSTVRTEDAINGGDKWAVDQVLGLAWAGGNLTATFSWSDTSPINTARTGYITNDMRYLGGYDNRSPLISQPGGQIVFDLSTFTLAGLSLPASFDGTENWTAADLTAANFQAARGDFVPRDQSSDTRTQAAYVNIKQALSQTVDGFIGVRYSRNEVEAVGSAPLILTTVAANNPYNRLGVPVFVGYAATYETANGLIPLDYSTNVLTDLGFEGGLTLDLPVRGWRADVSAVHSFAKSHSGGESYPVSFITGPVPGQVLNLFGNGTAQNVQPFLDAFGPRTNYTDRKTLLTGLTASAEGSVMQLPAGDLRGVIGSEYRIESLEFGAGDYLANMSLTDKTPEQDIAAVFAEARVPVLRGLTATAQGRWERYEVKTTDPAIDGKTFEEFSPRIGLTWEATPALTLRGSWGQSFKAPNLTNLTVIENVGTAPSPSPVFDPVRNENVVGVFFDRVGNPQLEPESGETLNLGFDWKPRAVPGLRTSLSYNRTDFSDRIVGSVTSLAGVSQTQLLSNPEAFPGVAVRDPVTNRLLRIRTFPFNVSRLLVEGVDFDARLTLDSALGEFHTGLQGTYTIKYDQQAAAIVPSLGLQGTTDADRLVAVMSVGWSRQGYGVDLYGNYTSAYWNTEIRRALSQLVPLPSPMHVRSRTTWDLTGYYDFGQGWRVSAGARNLFDEDFPFHQGFAGPYDTRRVDLRGRLLHLEVRKDFSF